MREKDLLEYLRTSVYPDLVKSEGTFDTFDCISQEHKAYIELKCRATHYPTLLIEDKKYRKLMYHAAELGLNPFYINSTPEGIYSFNLTNIAEPEWFVHKMPVTTEFSNRSKVDKLVGYLDIEEAVKYELRV